MISKIDRRWKFVRVLLRRGRDYYCWGRWVREWLFWA